MDNRVRLKVMGISFTPVQSGAYALILAEVNGPYRIPIVIGAAEAQSIAIRMEKIIPPRPLSHDLFVSFAHVFGVRLKEVFISKFEDGIFTAEMTFSDGERTVVLDARTSDAIAIAMRAKAPIYTTRKIVDETGFLLEEKQSAVPDESELKGNEGETEDTMDFPSDDPERYSVEELERTLAKLIEQENYEEARRISNILLRKRGEKE